MSAGRPSQRPRVGIVDYGLGNLFSVQQAATVAGLDTFVSEHAGELGAADGLILPGVGAFGDAMDSLRQKDLVAPLKDFAASGKPVMGVCLGMQLLMEESMEFGKHKGFGLFPGVVERLAPGDAPARCKVPHIGWDAILPPAVQADLRAGAASVADCWRGTPLDGIAAGEFMYFVHSYRVKETSPEVVLAVSTYCEDTYCSAIARGNVSAFQFHPEKSGVAGLRIYRNFAAKISLSLCGGTACP